MIRRDHTVGSTAGAFVGVCLCALGFLVLLFTLACPAKMGDLIGGAATSTLTSVPTNTPVPTDTATSANPPGPQPGKVGDVAVEGGFSLSALAVENPAKPGIDMWYYPEPGTKRVAVEIVVGCVSCEKATVHPVFAVLVDADDSAYMAELGPVIDYDEITATDIEPGEYVRGWVAFEVPDTAVPMYVKYLFGHGITLQTRLAK